MTNAIEPKPGFDWSKVQWGAPDDVVSDDCSYCGAAIPDEAVPLRLWNQDGWAAVFCDGCMATWWGMTAIASDPDDVAF